MCGSSIMFSSVSFKAQKLLQHPFLLVVNSLLKKIFQVS